MAKFDKFDVQQVMQHAKCDERTARLYLKAHRGNFARAVVAAREDVALTEIGKMGKPITLQDLICGGQQ